MRRRLFWLTVICHIAIAVLTGRLFLLSVLPESGPAGGHQAWQARLPARAELEHLQLLETDDGRGRILYRSGEPWSGFYRHALFGDSGRVRIHSEFGAGVKDRLIGQVGRPDVWPTADKAAQEQGRSGMEYTFDRVLQGERPGLVGVVKDPSGALHPDTRLRIEPLPGADIRTTIDRAWQQVAMDALTKQQVQSGAVVVLDVPSNQALAIAQVDRTGPSTQPAFEAQTPGSIFKLAVAAGALESHRFRGASPFFCLGRVELPGVRMHCWRAHGRETLVDAIAQSCDVAFAQIGVALGRQGVAAITHRLRLDTTGLQAVDRAPVLPGVHHGVTFRVTGDDNGLLANTAIGQQDVRMTPVVAASLARTIAAMGVYRPVTLVLDAERHGHRLRGFAPHVDERVMSRATAWWIANGMRESVVSANGTAHALASAPVSAAIKTGTAELTSTRTPQHGVDAGRYLVNGWIIGYAPYDHPRIAFAVYVGREPSRIAHRQVREITAQLLRAYRQFHGPKNIG